MYLDPTFVSVGKVALTSVTTSDFLAAFQIDSMTQGQLLEMYQSWDSNGAAALESKDNESILQAFNGYLDPDGDGEVAVFEWQTLEERGTLGFHVERKVDDQTWQRINQRLLPGLVTSESGGDYVLVDPGATPGQTYEYRLIEQEASGRTRTYGPYTLEMQ